jgi:hypothetical protein
MLSVIAGLGARIAQPISAPATRRELWWSLRPEIRAMGTVPDIRGGVESTVE